MTRTAGYRGRDITAGLPLGPCTDPLQDLCKFPISCQGFSCWFHPDGPAQVPSTAPFLLLGQGKCSLLVFNFPCCPLGYCPIYQRRREICHTSRRFHPWDRLWPHKSHRWPQRTCATPSSLPSPRKREPGQRRLGKLSQTLPAVAWCIYFADIHPLDK